ncbi:hypothetical protein [Winogradskyella sp. UBA3174]|uniref:hypothetical protein n=1 Tax=Winogradskyella sp. UBA3174 TaxID=1947785 RepID=UPI0025FD3790|nr:hypothetical protein [Winogradskyella sp. UBA3174]|tara:strand:+ start:20488 stop:20844 length:357 start_codon:yes stop_codon:yes gene_type:complete
MKKDAYLEKAVVWANNKSTISFKSISKGYESPRIFTSKTTHEEIQADLSFVTHGGVKHYSVIALKNENQKKTVAKWKVLSFLASIKRGRLHLLAPHGHKAYAEKLVDTHNIDAIIHAL